MAVEGGVVSYRRNGELVYSSTRTPRFPLLVDTSIHRLGSGFTNVVLSGELVQVAVAPPVLSLPTGHYTSNQAVVIAAEPQATIHYTTTGVDPTEADQVIAAGGSVAIEQDTVLKARAWAPGLIASGTTTATYTLGEVTTEPVAWTAGVNVSTAGGDVWKTAGSDSSWDAGAVSTRALVSMDGYVEFVAEVATGNRMLGLSNGDTDQGYPDIDFAVYLSGNSVSVYESGISRGAFGTYAVGDRFRVALEGGVVKYRRNGELLYTSTVPPRLPLLVDTSLHRLNSAFRGVVISGKLDETILPAPAFTPAPGVLNGPQDAASRAWPARHSATRSTAASRRPAPASTPRRFTWPRRQ